MGRIIIISLYYNMYRINPEYQNVQINLNSDDDAVRKEDSTSDTDLSFQFNRIVTVPVNYNMNLSLNQIEIPHSWYTFDEDVSLKVKYLLNIVGTTPLEQDMIIPKGFYTISSLKKKVGDVMASSTLNPKPPQWNILGTTFNQSTLKWYWSNASRFQFVWTVTKTDTLQMLQRFFGMPETAGKEWDSTPAQGGGEEMTSVSVADATRYHNLYITTGDFSTGSIDSNYRTTESALCKIPIDAPFGSIVNYKGSIDDGYLYQMRSFNKISIALRDHRSQLIELNGARFNVSLLLQFIKRDLTALGATIPRAIPFTPAPQSQPQKRDVRRKLKDRVKKVLNRKRTKGKE